MMEPLMMLDRLEVGVVLQDAENRLLYANESALEQLGLAREELLSRTSHDPKWDCIHPDGRPFPASDFPAVLATRTGKAQRGAVIGIARPRNQGRVWLLVDAVPITDAAGTSTPEVLITLTNISRERVAQQELQALNNSLARAVESRTTELSQTIKALRESESNSRAVIRAMAEGVAIHDEHGFITMANPAAQYILGLTIDQMQGRHPVDPAWKLTRVDGTPLPPEEIPSEITQRTGNPCNNVILGVHRGNGEQAWLSINTDPIHVEGEENHRGVVATFTDVTVERGALSALEASRARLQRVVEAMPGVLLEEMMTESGERFFSYVGGQVERAFGVGPDEVASNPEAWWSRIHPDHRSHIDRIREEALSSGSSIDEEIRLVDVDGEQRWARLRSAPPTEVAGGLLTRSIVLDTSDERRIALKLREAQRQEAMGTLAAGIAHNFNNMLAAILPNIELAQARTSGEDRVVLDEAHSAATAAAELVEQLLLIARPEADRPRGFEPVDIAEVAREVVQVCHRTFDRRVTIDSDIPNEPVFVRGRRAGLQQVILNLCINSRDALECVESPSLRVSLEKISHFASIEVSDNGIGMDEATLARVGEPFFTTKEPGFGTGLGVATAKGIVRDLGGEFRFTSEPGQGARFTIQVPLCLAAPKSAPPTSSRSRMESFDNRLVLIIDDEDLVRQSMVRMIERFGLSTVAAEDGAQGLRLLDANPEIQAVFVDLSMPGLSGYDVLEQIRTVHPDLAVFVVSGHIPDPGVLSQATGILMKPFQLEQLQDCLRQCFVSEAESKDAST